MSSRSSMICATIAALVCNASPAQGQGMGTEHPQSVKPSSIMGLSSIAPGHFMLSYRFRYMSMGSNHMGTDHLEPREVLATFPIAPISMQSSNHMLEAMAGLTNSLSVQVMVPLRSRSMLHEARSRDGFRTSSTGVGDLSIGLRHSATRGPDLAYDLGVVVSVPTGSINATDVTPASDPHEVVLPYPMQNGSGTVDFSPSVAVLLKGPLYSLGTSARVKIRAGRNERSYKLGDEWVISSWIGGSLWGRHNGTLTIAFADWDDITGEDRDLAAQVSVVPTADPMLRAGREVRVEPEFQFAPIMTSVGRHQVAIGARLPLWHSFGGPQLGLSWSTHLTWTFMPG